MERPILMEHVQPPIIVFAVENPVDLHIVDLALYSCAEHAISGVEHYEVNDGLYEVFDSEGRRLTFHADERDKVHLSCTEKEPTGNERLKTLLIFYLTRSKPPLSIDLSSVQAMLEYAAGKYLYKPLPPLRIILWGWLKRLFGVTPK